MSVVVRGTRVPECDRPQSKGLRANDSRPKHRFCQLKCLCHSAATPGRYLLRSTQSPTRRNTSSALGPLASCGGPGCAPAPAPPATAPRRSALAPGPPSFAPAAGAAPASASEALFGVFDCVYCRPGRRVVAVRRINRNTIVEQTEYTPKNGSQQVCLLQYGCLGRCTVCLRFVCGFLFYAFNGY